MKSITFNYGKVNFSAPFLPLLDKYRGRIPNRRRFTNDVILKFEYSDINHIWTNFELEKAVIRVDGCHPAECNGFHGFLDVELSPHKYLFGGDNSGGFTPSNHYLYRNNFDWNFNNLQWNIRHRTGTKFNIFKSACSRLHVDMNFDCGTPQKAKKLRDDWYENIELPYLPNKIIPQDYPETRYWNNRSYILDGTKAIQSNKTFALYPKGKILHAEIRYNNPQSVYSLINSSMGKALGLRNNFKSFSQQNVMNEIFWKTAIKLFAEPDKEKIKNRYSLLYS